MREFITIVLWWLRIWPLFTDKTPCNFFSLSCTLSLSLSSISTLISHLSASISTLRQPLQMLGTSHSLSDTKEVSFFIIPRNQFSFFFLFCQLVRADSPTWFSPRNSEESGNGTGDPGCPRFGTPSCKFSSPLLVPLDKTHCSLFLCY